jgi:hypothetical protein
MSLDPAGGVSLTRGWFFDKRFVMSYGSVACNIRMVYME